MNTELIAHIREKDGATQSLAEHLSAVSALAGGFAAKIGLEGAGRLIGQLHDLGKASQVFQNYLRSADGKIGPDEDEYIDPIAKKGKIDHSTAGAQVVYEAFTKGPGTSIAAQVYALCIASHHSGLIDCLLPDGRNDFQRRIKKSEEDAHKIEAQSHFPNLGQSLDKENGAALAEKRKQLLEENDSKETAAFKDGLLIRFLLSCLLDADRLDTARFEMPNDARFRNCGNYSSWDTLLERLGKKIREFETKEERNEVDELRTQVSQACRDFATKPKGIYQLTVPTGGGKTWASMRFALHHAAEHKMDRILYVIPYTSIIDQNAQEIREVLEDKTTSGKYLDKVVLEHHSNLTPEEESYRQNLLAQNWDAPIIFTTQVQFLEALFGQGTRSARRMHQLANAVIILDEIQAIPIKMIHMLNTALRFLVKTCGATVVLCTATQPPLNKINAKHRALTINSEQRMIQNEKELFKNLKRVHVFDERKSGGWSEEEVAELAVQQLQETGSVLIVVNTKRSARAIYHAIYAKKLRTASLYHLSTNMCPAHRLDVLDQVREKLKSEGQEPVICVSTQLIEAGVDIDFGSVIRYLAGLDSIAQAAGRCNRHGKRKNNLGNVFIVNPATENLGNLDAIQIGSEQTRRVLSDFKENPEAFEGERIGPEAMAAYYEYYYYQRRNEMAYKVGTSSPVGRDDDLFNLLSTNTISVNKYQRIHKSYPNEIFRQSFKTAAKSFHVIDSATQGVVVPYGSKGTELVKDLCRVAELEKQYKLLRKAQRFSVNLFPKEFEDLLRAKVIHEAQERTGVYYLSGENYSNEFGWSENQVKGMETLTTG